MLPAYGSATHTLHKTPGGEWPDSGCRTDKVIHWRAGLIWANCSTVPCSEALAAHGHTGSLLPGTQHFTRSHTTLDTWKMLRAVSSLSVQCTVGIYRHRASLSYMYNVSTWHRGGSSMQRTLVETVGKGGSVRRPVTQYGVQCTQVKVGGACLNPTCGRALIYLTLYTDHTHTHSSQSS